MRNEFKNDTNRLNLLLLLITGTNLYVQTSWAQRKSDYMKDVTGIDGLVAVWDFKEKPGKDRKAYGLNKFALQEVNGKVERINEGPLSGYSALFKDSVYLKIPNDQTGALNIHGKNSEVIVLAWVKWTGNRSFVGGMWNEYQDGGKRQYGLFVSLPFYNGADQVCGHISLTGIPTPPFPYSIDYSASMSLVKNGEWQCIAFTYDGDSLKSYLDGKFEYRKPELISHTKGFEGSPQGLMQSKNPYYFPHGMGNNGQTLLLELYC